MFLTGTHLKVQCVVRAKMLFLLTMIAKSGYMSFCRLPANLNQAGGSGLLCPFSSTRRFHPQNCHSVDVGFLFGFFFFAPYCENWTFWAQKSQDIISFWETQYRQQQLYRKVTKIIISPFLMFDVHIGRSSWHASLWVYALCCCYLIGWFKCPIKVTTKLKKQKQKVSQNGRGPVSKLNNCTEINWE